MINFFDCEDDILAAINEINSSLDYNEHCAYSIPAIDRLVLRWPAPSVTEAFDVMAVEDELVVYDIDGAIVDEVSYGDDVYNTIMSVYGYVRRQHF